MQRNRYPPFEKVPVSLRPTAVQQLQRLQVHLGGGIRMPHKPILHAPWVGRIYNGRGTKMSYGTAEGWLRHALNFWTAFEQYFGEDYALIERGRRVSEGLAQLYEWPEDVVGQRLVHHHLDNGPITVALPENLHTRFYGVIHKEPTLIV